MGAGWGGNEVGGTVLCVSWVWVGEPGGLLAFVCFLFSFCLFVCLLEHEVRSLAFCFMLPGVLYRWEVGGLLLVGVFFNEALSGCGSGGFWVC